MAMTHHTRTPAGGVAGAGPRWPCRVTRRFLPVVAIVVAIFGASQPAVAQFDRPLATSILFAALSGTDGTDDTEGTAGECAALVSQRGHAAALHCTLAAGLAVDTFVLSVDIAIGSTTVSAATSVAVSGPGPYVFSLDQPPAALIDAFTRLEARIEGRTASGPVVQGQFTFAGRDRTSVSLDGGQVVPPSATAATGSCVVVSVEGVPPFVGLDCTHSMAGAEMARFHSGGRGETGPALIELTLPPNTPNPVVLQSTTDTVVTELWNMNLYVEVGGVGGALIRGQADGCRQSDGMVCLHDRFEVTALGEQFIPELEIPGAVDAISDSLGLFSFITIDEVGRTEHVHGASVRLRDRCATTGRYEAHVRQLTNASQELDVTITDVRTGRVATYGLRDGQEVADDTTTFACG